MRFHLIESVLLAVNDTIHITDPAMLRAVMGFHGSGGAHPKEPNLNLNAALEEVASGRGRQPLEELPIAVTGHLCGAPRKSLAPPHSSVGPAEAYLRLNGTMQITLPSIHLRGKPWLSA